MTDKTLSGAATRAAAGYLDSWLAYRQRYLRIPGVQAALGVADEIVLSTAHGHADVEANTALRPEHLFRIASHSKTFTATAVLQLVEAGRLRLDDPVGAHLTWLAGTPLAQVSLRELLAHGGGVVRDGHAADHWQLSHPFPDDDGLRRMATDDAATLVPNERFKYSNVGYSLLGAVVSAASGRPYNDYVAERVVAPLGLRDTFPEWRPDRAADYAAGYSSLAYADRRVPIEHVDTRAMSAATGFTSTAADACRWVAAHYRGDERVLGERSKRLMQRSEWVVRHGRADSDSEYGLGWDIDEVDGVRLLGHGGGYPGHATRTFFDPDGRVAISVLTNAIDGPARGLAVGALKLIGLAATEPAAGERVDATADRFCGRFANLWGVTDVVRLGERLLVVDPDADDPAATSTVLAVVGPDRLQVRDAGGFAGYGEQIVYDFADGAVRDIRGPQGMTSFPFEAFAESVARCDRVGPGRIAV